MRIPYPMGRHDPRPCACIYCNDPCWPALDDDALCADCRKARTAGETCHTNAKGARAATAGNA